MEPTLHFRLFFIEGSITILIAFISMGLLPNYPNSTMWLTAEQRHLAQVRVVEDIGEADVEYNHFARIFEGLILAIKDLKVYLFILLSVLEALGASFSNFFPTFTSTLGYSTTITLLIAAPPWVVPAITNLFDAWHADRTGERFFHLIIWWGVAIVGYIIAASTMATAPRYFSLYLMTIGYTGNAVTIVWAANTFPRPPSKRAVALALVTSISRAGSIIGSYIWKASWGPRYHQTMLITSCSYAFGIIVACSNGLLYCYEGYSNRTDLVLQVIRRLLICENKHMEQLEIDSMERAQLERIEKAAELEGTTFEEAVMRRKQFRYLY
ncbi:hypothetical protein ID866_6984 [Astraeus odoratus]|nr:hypothetical protein ID866_6984 [Astraeus odoratus]